jgi:hypothetical protein
MVLITVIYHTILHVHNNQRRKSKSSLRKHFWNGQGNEKSSSTNCCIDAGLPNEGAVNPNLVETCGSHLRSQLYRLKYLPK